MVTPLSICQYPLFVHNNEYFFSKAWEIVKNIKTDVNRLIFLENKKNLFSVLSTL